MGFPPVPKESRSKINKAGKILVQDNPPPQDLVWARDLADKWRACHAYPINTFQATLRHKLNNFNQDPIAAQRLKRMATITDKLRRYPTMKLTTMQDIGGVRAIVGSVKDVYTLADEYRNSRRLAHELINQKDYIQNPRSEDGYRSLHLIYKYKNRKVPRYDGLRLELQIRTKLQHTWASAVETMEIFLKQALRFREGDQEWIDFFAVVSSAFAYRERRPLVPRFNHLSAAETRQSAAEAESRLRALERMRGFSAAINVLPKRKGTGRRRFYHLIVFSWGERNVRIMSYDREDFEEAVKDYGSFEARAAQGERIEPVLVSAGPMDKLRRAYPNFFLDVDRFVRIVSKMLET